MTNQGEANLPKSRNKIVAGGSNVAGVGKVALVQIIAPRPVPSQALGAHPALVVRGLLYVVTLNIFKARSRHFLADVRHTICSVTSVPLQATKICINIVEELKSSRGEHVLASCLSFIPEDRVHTYRRVDYCPGSRTPPRSKAQLHMHPTHRIDRHPV